VFDKVKDGIEANSAEERKVCVLVITTIYKKFGFKKVEGLISSLSIKSLELLVKEIPEADTYIKIKKQNIKS
jgi:hypothetical protein